MNEKCYDTTTLYDALVRQRQIDTIKHDLVVKFIFFKRLSPFVALPCFRFSTSNEYLYLNFYIPPFC